MNEVKCPHCGSYIQSWLEEHSQVFIWQKYEKGGKVKELSREFGPADKVNLLCPNCEQKLPGSVVDQLLLESM